MAARIRPLRSTRDRAYPSSRRGPVAGSQRGDPGEVGRYVGRSRARSSRRRAVIACQRAVCRPRCAGRFRHTDSDPDAAGAELGRRRVHCSGAGGGGGMSQPVPEAGQRSLQTLLSLQARPGQSRPFPAAADSLHQMAAAPPAGVDYLRGAVFRTASPA